MSTPRHLIVLLVAVSALALSGTAAAALADRTPAGSGSSLALQNGKGLAVLTSNSGSVLGTIVDGRITLTDYVRGAPTKFDARTWGCETRRRPNPRTVVCIGQSLHFSIVNGAWLASLKGRGIAASAVVTGKVLLRGTRGTFKINDGRWRRWPEIAHTYRLP